VFTPCNNNNRRNRSAELKSPRRDRRVAARKGRANLGESRNNFHKERQTLDKVRHLLQESILDKIENSRYPDEIVREVKRIAGEAYSKTLGCDILLAQNIENMGIDQVDESQKSAYVRTLGIISVLDDVCELVQSVAKCIRNKRGYSTSLAEKMMRDLNKAHEYLLGSDRYASKSSMRMVGLYEENGAKIKDSSSLY
jgi:hypothetical protein